MEQYLERQVFLVRARSRLHSLRYCNCCKSKRGMARNFSCERMDHTAQKIKFSIKDFLSKRDQIRSLLRLHLLKKSLMGNFIFCIVSVSKDLFAVLSIAVRFVCIKNGI